MNLWVLWHISTCLCLTSGKCTLPGLHRITTWPVAMQGIQTPQHFNENLACKLKNKAIPFEKNTSFSEAKSKQDVLSLSKFTRYHWKSTTKTSWPMSLEATCLSLLELQWAAAWTSHKHMKEQLPLALLQQGHQECPLSAEFQAARTVSGDTTVQKQKLTPISTTTLPVPPSYSLCFSREMHSGTTCLRFLPIFC